MIMDNMETDYREVMGPFEEILEVLPPFEHVRDYQTVVCGNFAA